MFHAKKIAIVCLLLIGCFLLILGCSQNENNAKDVRGPEYAGAAACQSCHQEIAHSYAHTTHAITSRLANDSTIYGEFTPPGNVFSFPNEQQVVAQQKDDHFYQTGYEQGKQVASFPFDIVIGSGTKAQTYLYNKGDSMMQLPLTWFTKVHAWANSPGFPADRPYFKRAIPSGCFGCHASAANVTYDQPEGLFRAEKYLAGQQLLGIDCERCHGPARQHVEFQTEHPSDTVAKFITPIGALSRGQQMDVCGVCHSGLKKAQQSLFNFRPGNRTEDFYNLEYYTPPPDERDVHGAQVPLLLASKCYQKSQTLTCLGCHDPHASQQNQLQVFSQRCMNCHSEANHNFCTLPAKGIDLAANCIDCHMPAQPSKIITLLTNSQEVPVPDMIRTHLIKVYPGIADSILRLNK